MPFLCHINAALEVGHFRCKQPFVTCTTPCQQIVSDCWMNHQKLKLNYILSKQSKWISDERVFEDVVGKRIRCFITATSNDRHDVSNYRSIEQTMFCWDWQQRCIKDPCYCTFVRGISPYKGAVSRKMFTFDNVVMLLTSRFDVLIPSWQKH